MAALPATETQLLRYITPDETAADFLQRTSREALPTGLPAVDQHVTFRPGHVLEVAGPTMSGKSELLVQIITHFLLTHAGGAGQAAAHVVLVDCDGKFDTLRLLQVLNARLSAAPCAQGSDPLEAALARLHMVRVHSSAELLALLLSLPQQLEAVEGVCKLLLIDNITAYGWQDRALKPITTSTTTTTTPAATTGPSPSLTPVVLTWQAAQAALAKLVRHTCDRLHLAAVVTRQTLVKAVGDAAGGGVSLDTWDQLPPAWQEVVTLRLLVSPAAAVPLPPQQQQSLAQLAVPGATLLLGQLHAAAATPPVALRILDTSCATQPL